MQLIVVGSSSSGNCYALKAKDGQILVMEAGCPIIALKRAIDFHLADVAGVFVTHEHGDHASRCAEYAKGFMACQFMSRGTLEALQESHPAWVDPSRVTGIEHGEVTNCGGFKVTALQLKNSKGESTHDAREPFCYLIEHDEMGKLLFATDTYLMPYRPKGLTAIMIECNYTSDLLEENYRNGVIDSKRRTRTVVSHMSLENCISTLGKMDLTLCRKVVLVHISHENGSYRRFRDAVEESIGLPVAIAADGAKISLSKDAF